jgi:large subunit ribosomal protein L29|uniref:Large ribosomal subunit protein uL29 n=1 Tax=Candidatus Methanophagaceae archaeon ANME-1 ERB6 TaxID=2759912 RepID=A0A7G9YU19_9EURY|nr:50S ribosomal protein L29 [Methanosarcinales archaeon ANME-1 ERB6]
MSIFRIDEIRKMSEIERKGELESLRMDLMRERGIIATGGAPDNPGRVREIRRTIARIKTVEGELGRETEK